MYQTLPAFHEFVHEQSRLFLSHNECACCGSDMQGSPHGIVGVSVTFKPGPDATRHYFPLYHLVCKTCFDLIWSWEDVSMSFRQSDLNQPKWSQLWALTYEHRPYGLTALDDEEGLTNLFETMAWETSDWEDFSFRSFFETMEEFLSFY